MARMNGIIFAVQVCLALGLSGAGARAQSMHPDAFPGPGLDGQWTWENQGSSLAAGGLTVMDPADDNAWWSYGVGTTSGYAIPSGDTTITIDLRALSVTTGWGYSRFIFTTTDSQTLIFEIYHHATSPYYRGRINGSYGAAYNDLTGTHSIKFVRIGSTVSIYRASYQGNDWTLIASGSGFSTAAGTVRISETSPVDSGQTVVWEKFNWSRFVEKFDTRVLEGPHWTGNGSSMDLLYLDNGVLTFDSSRDGSEPYTWLSMGSIERMDGDFQVDFAFSIVRMDYWNSFSLGVAALDGAWSARLVRSQGSWGDHQISAYSTTGGTETLQGSVAGDVTEGSLRIKRTGTSLTFWWKTNGGVWQPIGNPVTVADSAVGAGLSFNSAISTVSIVRLRSYVQEWTQSVPRYTLPDYSIRKILATESGGGIRLLRVENADLSDPARVCINPGGRAMYAVQGPLNARQLALAWQSSGALKVSVTRLGGAESIELGQTLIWDESATGQTESRAVDLDGFVTRMAGRRNWTLTHQTADNLYVVSFQPALGTPAVLVAGSVQLIGSSLMPLEPFVPATSATAAATPSGGGMWLLDWPKPTGTATWGEEPLLATGSVVTMGDVPFKVCPTVLGGSACGSAGIEVNRTAGIIHIAHVAFGNASGGTIPLSHDWVGGYMIVYDDGTTETIFCDLNWNCGMWSTNEQEAGMANTTWWGQPGFTWAKVHRLAWGIRHLFWASVYVTSYVNPHPEKNISRILAYVSPDNPQFALLGITLTAPESSYVGLVEPGTAAFGPTDDLRADVLLWRAATAPLSSGALWMAKSDQSTQIASADLTASGPFAATSFTFRPGDYPAVQPGPVRLQYRDTAGTVLASSSLLGYMPFGVQNFYFTMIGSADNRGEYERIRRLGYDVDKVPMWGVDANSLIQMDDTLNQINSVGLWASIRNLVSVPGTTKLRTDGLPNDNDPDLADPACVSFLTGYYGAVANFAKNYPYVININANYGCRERIGGGNVLYYGPAHQWPNFIAYLQGQTTLSQINSKSGTGFVSWDQITPAAVLGASDPSFLEANLLRAHNQDMAALQDAVVQAIRGAGFTGHLSFNTSLNHQVQRWDGSPFDEYLRLGRDEGPGSPFHESADRFCHSFLKWLAAKRTFDLPYGDEGYQCPPAYEHNVLAYQWMMVMQCKDAGYCQWYYGNPGSQNVAWLKPYYQLIYNAAYRPDPITLALSFESGYEEARAVLAGTTPQCHEGLANVLRELDMNVDRYIIDKFPEKDAAATGRLIIDDNNRYIDDGFANRLEQQIRGGKVFVATGETDILRNHSFLSRFGLTLTALSNQSAAMTVNGDSGNVTVSFPTDATSTRYSISGSGLTQYGYWNVSGSPKAVVAKTVGSGKIVVFGKGWDDGNAVGQMPGAYLEFCRSKFQTWGNFKRGVYTSDSDYAVHATPYRAANGALYVHLFNTAARSKTVELAVNTNLTSETMATDLGRGIALAVTAAADYRKVTTTVSELSSTVVMFGDPDFGPLVGDANADGNVQFDDFAILQNHYGQSGVGWSEGDFSGDGQVSFEDFSILQNHYGQTSSVGAGPAAGAAVGTEGCVSLGSALLALAGLGVVYLRKFV